MGWAVFAVAHCVVCEDENSWQLHQSRKPDGRTCVVAENEEGGAKRAQLRKRQSVHGRHHGVFSDAEMQVLSTPSSGLKISSAFEGQRGFVGRAKIRRTAQ